MDSLVWELLKKNNYMNIAACIMIHDDHEYTKMVLDDISKYTDQIYVNLNDPTPQAEEVVLSHKNVVKVMRTSNNGGRWNQGKQRTLTIRMLDDIKPDIVLFPDSDECYPHNFEEQLQSRTERGSYAYPAYWPATTQLAVPELPRPRRPEAIQAMEHQIQVPKSWQIFGLFVVLQATNYY